MGRPVSEGTYAWQMHQALQYRVADPCRLLAIGVLLRWAEDVRMHKAQDVELGPEWVELADVPEEWLEAIA